MDEEQKDRRYQPRGRGGEGPEDGSIMSSEVTLYLHPLRSGPGVMGRAESRGWVDGREVGGWMDEKDYGGAGEEKCRNEDVSHESVSH